MTAEQFGIGIMCDVIVFVPVFILVLLFKTSRRRVQRSNRANVAVARQETEWDLDGGSNGRGKRREQDSGNGEAVALSQRRVSILAILHIGEILKAVDHS
jgi:hypothetical protein